LINEYLIPADELRSGKLITVPALSECEDIVIDTPWSGKTSFEAFVTGGGSSNLPFLLKERARNVNYKTIRYRGHCRAMKAFAQLGFFSNTEVGLARLTQRDVLEQALNARLTSPDNNDIVIARAGARGTTMGGKLSMVIYDVFCEKDKKRGFSAMAQTTGYSAAIVAQLIAEGRVNQPGVVTGEAHVPGSIFISRLTEAGIKVRTTQK
jgi:saccharopine dehydrogenase-like NADP-dependent oxidoreductase